jgi:ribosome-associated protein
MPRGTTKLIPFFQRGAAPQPFHPVTGPSGPQSGSLVQSILTSLDDAKAEDVMTIDLHGKTNIADVMIIASGRSNTHVGAISERIIKAFKDAQAKPPRVEGLQNCDWVLVDAGDVIVHIFRPEVRQFYNLEKMWGVDRPEERRAS